MFELLLLATAIVLVFVVEGLQAPVPASAVETRDPELDHRVFLRLVAAGGIAASLLVAGVIAAYWANPDGVGSAVAWPISWVVTHPYSLLLSGVALYLVALLCGVKQRQPVLLFCLTLPGMLAMPLVAVGTTVAGAGSQVAAVLLLFIFQPATWIFIFIGVGQGSLLRKPGGNFTPSGLARIFLVVITYLYGTFF